MLENRTRDFLQQLRRDDGEVGVDAQIFSYLLREHLFPVYKPTKETQDCLFVGVGYAEVDAVRYFLRKSYGYPQNKVFAVGLSLHTDPYRQAVCDFFVGDEILGNAASSGTYEQIRAETGRDLFDLVAVRRFGPLANDHPNLVRKQLGMIVKQAEQHLGRGGRLVATSGFADEDDGLREVMESSSLRPLVSQPTKLRDIGWNTEGYIYIAEARQTK